MKKILTLFFLVSVVWQCWSQDFFNTDFNTRKKYVILCDPRVDRIETIEFLMDNGLLKVNKKKVKFVGVYSEDQNYDFAKSKQYIEENKLDNFFLHEVKGDLNNENLFEENAISQELKKIFDNSVGVFFFGGPDIPPLVYKQENTKSVVTDPNRHYFESSFMFHLLGGFQNEKFKPFLEQRPDYFVTGFCLGLQTMNVATGGTLIQDIPAELFGAQTPEATLKIGRTNLHRNYWQKMVEDSLFMGGNLHTIRFSAHEFFGERINIPKQATPRIYSSHHQAVKKLGKGMEETCSSPDGKIIEGLAHRNYPHVFAVQFHPEIPALYEDMYERRFHPEDDLKTYHEILSKSDIRFHEKYWKYISDTLARVKRFKPKKN